MSAPVHYDTESASLVFLGRLAAVRDTFELADCAGKLLTALDAIAALAGIDLGAAIVAKFNQTNTKIGYPQRLAP